MKKNNTKAVIIPFCFLFSYCSGDLILYDYSFHFSYAFCISFISYIKAQG